MKRTNDNLSWQKCFLKIRYYKCDRIIKTNHDRIDKSKGIDLTKCNNSQECVIFHYWFLNHGLQYRDSVCNGCHDLTMLSI